MYFAQTLWLFTLSDIKTLVIPETSFGLLGALAGPPLTKNRALDIQAIMRRTPQVLVWTWLNTLIFDLANQRLPDSIREDAINKAWRPLPAGRIEASGTRRLLLQSILIVVFVSWCLGAAEEKVLLLGLDWMYNDLGGADESYIVRNLIISAAYACYGSGALRIASLGEDFFLEQHDVSMDSDDVRNHLHNNAGARFERSRRRQGSPTKDRAISMGR